LSRRVRSLVVTCHSFASFLSSSSFVEESARASREAQRLSRSASSWPDNRKHALFLADPELPERGRRRERGRSARATPSLGRTSAPAVFARTRRLCRSYPQQQLCSIQRTEQQARHRPEPKTPLSPTLAALFPLRLRPPLPPFTAFAPSNLAPALPAWSCTACSPALSPARLTRRATPPSASSPAARSTDSVQPRDLSTTGASSVPLSGVHRETGEADQARAALCREADRAWLRPEELARRQQTAYGGSCHCSSSQLAVSSALRSSGPAPVAVGRGDDAALPRIWSERRTERRPSSSALRLAFELAKLLSARWSRSPTRAELWLRRARGELGLAGRLSSRRPPALLLTSSAPPLSEG